MKQNYPKIAFYLDEVGNGQLGDFSFQQNFGEALWAVDMQLYAMVQVSLPRNSSRKVNH